MITLIAAVDKKYGLGANGKLLAMVPEDMKRFKEKTLNQIVIMGKTTWLSLPLRETIDSLEKTHALKGRKNVVLSFNKQYFHGAYNLNSVEEVLQLAKTKDIFIIGGASIYEQFYQYADVIELTVFNTIFEEADIFFPQISFNDFNLVEAEAIQTSDKTDFNIAFLTFARIK